MRAFRIPRPPHHQEIGEAGRQEFAAGAIPLRSVAALLDAPLVLVQHRRGVMRAFDKHLEAVRERDLGAKRVDYQLTWLGLTGCERHSALVRLELKIDGLRARPRLLFEGGALEPLWLLAKGEYFGLVLDETTEWVRRGPGPDAWVLGPTPVAGELGRILRDVGVPAPTKLLHDRRRLHRRIEWARSPRRAA